MANYTISGELSPDATGIYVEAGTCQGKPLYRHGWWWLRWNPTSGGPLNTPANWAIQYLEIDPPLFPVGGYLSGWYHSSDEDTPPTANYEPCGIAPPTGTALLATYIPKTRSNTNVLNINQDSNVNLDAGQINENWLRWIYASIGVHFEQYKGDYQLYHEGDERGPAVESFAELRVDGPLILVPQKGLYYLDYDINILVQSKMNPVDLYNMHRVLGKFIRGIQENIQVYKYGNGPLDDQSLIGCLRLHHTKRSANRGIEVNTFGIVSPSDRLTQATVEGHYRIELGVLANVAN